MKQVTINFNSKQVEAQLVKVLEHEPINGALILEDGNIINMRLIAQEVFKLPENDPITGLPQYFVRSQTLLSVEAGGKPTRVH